MKLPVRFLISIISFLAVIFLIGPGYYFVYSPHIKSIESGESAEAVVERHEMQFSDIKPGNESRFQWANSDQRKTEIVFVYLHGFSASPREVSPVVEELSSGFKANSYFPRFSGHGLRGDTMENLTADELFQDAEDAYFIAKKLGEKIVLVGTSTGATLALWLAQRHSDIAALVLISPNLGIKDPRGFLAAGPLGYYIARAVAGPFHDWKPHHPDQEKFWTTHYSVNGIRAMTDVVNEVAHSDLKIIHAPILCFWSPLDEVVDIQKALRLLKDLRNEKNQFVEIKTSEHVLAGAITAPENIPPVRDAVTQFLRSVF